MSRRPLSTMNGDRDCLKQKAGENLEENKITRVSNETN